MIGKTRSPFHSSDVKSIYANMSSQEYSKIEWEIYNHEKWYGLTLGVFVVAFLNSYALVKLLTLSLFLLQVFNKNIKLKTLLCSTEWAKAQGYTPETLKLYSFNILKGN